MRNGSSIPRTTRPSSSTTRSRLTARNALSASYGACRGPRSFSPTATFRQKFRHPLVAAEGLPFRAPARGLRLPPPSPGRGDNLNRLARFDLGLRATGQRLDAAVIAADGIAAELARAPAHHAGIGHGAETAEDRRLHRP